MLLEKLHYLCRGADFVVFAGSLPRGVDEGFYARAIREPQPPRRPDRARRGGRAAPARRRGASRTSSRPNQREAEQRRRAGARGRRGLPDGARHDRRARRPQRAHHARGRLLRAHPRGAAGAALPGARAAASSRSRWSARATCCSRSSSRRSSRGRPAEEALRLAVAAGAASTLEVGAGPLRPARRRPVSLGRRRGRGARTRSRQTLVRKAVVPCSPLERLQSERRARRPRDRGEVRPRKASPSTTSCSSRPSRPCCRTTSRTRDAADARRSRSRSRSSPRRWTPSPRRGSRSRSRGRAGIGIVHRNLSIEDQVAEVDKVKRSEAGMIVEPVTLGPTTSSPTRSS